MSNSREVEDAVGAETLTESERYRILATERRRTTIDVLTDLTAPVDVEDVAAEVAARDSDVETVDEAAVRRATISLHHVDLPLMAEFGIVSYDPETNRIESCPDRFDR